MIRNYFKTLMRNMQKHKLHTAINIIGMAVAFTCTIFLLLLVYFQFSFDSFHQNKARLYQVYSATEGPQGREVSSAMGYPAAPAFTAENIGIQKATRYRNGGRGVRYGEKELELQVQLVDTAFFSMFTFPVVAGNRTYPLADESSVVLTEYAADRIFGKQSAIGKQINVNVNGVWKLLQVASVLKDFPENSSLKFDLLVRSESSPDYAATKDAWSTQHHSVFVQLAPTATRAQVERQLRTLVKKYNVSDTAFLKNKGYQADANGDFYAYHLLPLNELHFNREMGGGGAVTKSFLYVLLLISLVIVLIACFNFINLNTGLAFTRTKEMGIRKCLGAGKRQVWLQIWGESFFSVLIAMLIGAATTALLVRYFAKTARMGLSTTLLAQPAVIGILIGLLLLVSVAAAGYPSVIMTRLKTVEILKGKISLKRPGLFRNALIVIQFIIACVLISTTLLIYRQFQHLRAAPLGYTTASLISIPIHDRGAGSRIVASMRNRLAAQASIVSVSGSTVNLGIGQDGGTSKSTSSFDFNGRAISTNWMTVDYDFLKTLNITPTSGRDFSLNYAADSNQAVIVTESMARQLADQEALGLAFYSDSAQPKWNVVGIIPDFHLYSMHEKSEPLTLSLGHNGGLDYVLIRVATQNLYTTMSLVKSTYAQVEPGVEFKGTYVDDNIARWYESEQMLFKMFSIAAAVAIVLSCMGLFGIAFIIIRQRVKEIGVRKVLGASTGNVAVLVTKEFIKPVLVAIVIAMPLAWWAGRQWLQGFEYRIATPWDVFFAAAFVAVFIAVATVSMQAIRAAVANPVKSLRFE